MHRLLASWRLHGRSVSAMLDRTVRRLAVDRLACGRRPRASPRSARRSTGRIPKDGRFAASPGNGIESPLPMPNGAFGRSTVGSGVPGSLVGGLEPAMQLTSLLAHSAQADRSAREFLGDDHPFVRVVAGTAVAVRQSLVVAVVLFAVAGVLALVGKKDVQQAAPPLPTETIASVQADVATLKESVSL
jgi:hypothetical protein